MKKIISTIISTALAASMMLSFTGCGESIPTDIKGLLGGKPEDTVQETTVNSPYSFSDDVTVQKHLALALGIRNGMAIPDIAPVVPLIEQIHLSGGTVDIYVTDGDPSANSTHFDVDAPDMSLSENNRLKAAEKDAADLTAAILEAKPKAEESDVLGAVNLAAEKLRSYTGEKSLVIFDSGVSTTGGLHQTTFEDLDVDATVSDLIAKRSVTDYSDMKIAWFCFASADGEQPKLADIDYYNLRDEWTKIFTSGGAKTEDITIDRGSIANLDKQTKQALFDSYPSVTPVEVTFDNGGTHYYEPDTSEEETKKTIIDTGVAVNEQLLGFEKDSYVIADRDKAKKDLEGVAKAIKDSPELNVILIGSIAKVGEEESGKEFSLKRAEALRDLFVEMGVPSEQMKTAGAGYSDPNFYTDDNDANGNLIESLAKMNRCVYVLNADTDERAKPYLK